MRFSRYLVFAGALAGWGCGDSGDRPPASNFTGSDDSSSASGGSTSSGTTGSGGDTTSMAGAAGEGPSGSGGSTASGGSGGSSDGGSGGGGAGNANSGSGGSRASSTSSTDGPTMLPEVDACPSDDVEDPPGFETVCDLEPSWSEGQSLTLGETSDVQLIAITPDELTVAWFSPGGSVGQFSVADRATTDDEFGAAMPVTAGTVLFVSPDGLRLVVTEQGVTLAALTRANRSSDFGEPSEGEFELVNAQAEESALLFGSVVIAPDDHTMYYTVAGFEDDEYPVYVSERSADEAWPVGSPLESCEFRAYGALVRSPTGMSADGLTLFFQDPAAGGARAAFRATTDSDFEWFVDLGPIGRAQPNAACDRLYYWDSGTSSVAVADRE